MTLKGDAKFKEKLTRGLKNDIRNLVNSDANSRKSKNLHFDGLFLSKTYKVLYEKELFYRRVMSHGTDSKFEENLSLSSKNDMRNLVNANASSGKSQDFHFDVLLLSKVYYT